MVHRDPVDLLDRAVTARFAADHLTALPAKALLYAAEPTFRETLYHCALRAVELGTPVEDLITGTGLGVFRPDAIASDKVGPTLDFLNRLDIVPVFAIPVQITGPLLREVWRYQLNAAPGALLKMFDLLYEAFPSVLALFAAGPGTAPVPCTVVLADAKGEADPREREGWELRSRLGSANRLQAYFHTADEPADVVRDGGVLLGPAGLAGALSWPPEPLAAAAVLSMTDTIRLRYADAARTVDQVDVLLQDDWSRSAAQPVDRWALLRHLGDTPAAYAGREENAIGCSGTDEWWARAGLLDGRRDYLSGRVTAGSDGGSGRHG